MTFCALLPSHFHLQQQYQNGESEENHEQFLKALQNAVTTFLNRVKSNHMRGRSITNDSAVLSLFQSINNMHPQLLDILNQLDEKRCECWGWQMSKKCQMLKHQHCILAPGLITLCHLCCRQCTTRGCRTSWLRSEMLGRPLTPSGMNTERSCVVLQRKQRDRGRSSWHKNWRSWGRRSRSYNEAFFLHWKKRSYRYAIYRRAHKRCVFELQEYLEMQRQLAIQRLQEQEKERQMRLEQQKHTIQMRAQMPAFSLPYAQVHNAYSITCSLNWVQCGCFAIEIKWMTNVWMCCHADAVFAAQCGRRGGVPARSSTQLPGNLQPRWFCGGFAYAQHLYEPAWAVGTTTVPSHARSCHRWGGQQEDTWRELNTFWWLTFWKNLTWKCKTLIEVFFLCPLFFQIQICTMRTCTSPQAPMGSLLRLLVRLRPLLVHPTPTISLHPHRATRSDWLPLSFSNSYKLMNYQQMI